MKGIIYNCFIDEVAFSSIFNGLSNFALVPTCFDGKDYKCVNFIPAHGKSENANKSVMVIVTGRLPNLTLRSNSVTLVSFDTCKRVKSY